MSRTPPPAPTGSPDRSTALPTGAGSPRRTRLVYLLAVAEERFPSRRAALDFLTSPQPSLGGSRPLELIGSDLGVRRVARVLASEELAGQE